MLESYLKKDQPDKPMVPYMYADLKALVKNLLQIIVKHEEIEKCKTGPQLKDLDLTNGSVFLGLKKMQMEFGGEGNLRKLTSKDTVIHQQIFASKKEAQVFVVTMLANFDRCPLVSNVIRSAANFDPTVLVSLPKTVLIKRMKTLLMEMMESKIMSSDDRGKTVSEFNGLIDSEVKKLRMEFEVFDQKLQRLDKFYFQKVQIQNCKTLSFLLKIMFTLSHGQAEVEHGFSINQQVTNQNMKSETIIARRFIKDHMIVNG